MGKFSLGVPTPNLGVPLFQKMSWAKALVVVVLKWSRPFTFFECIYHKIQDLGRGFTQ